MPYDDKNEFRKFVQKFLGDYGLRVDWLAKKTGILPRDFSSYINGKRNLSKSKRINLYRKILEYEDRNNGF